MKKPGAVFLFSFFLGILFFQLIFASTAGIPTISLQKGSFQTGETLLANITGTFVNPIKISDIKFWDGPKEVAFDSDLVLFNGTYYYYAYLNRAGNFTIRITNILYRGPELNSTTIEKQINIADMPITENNWTGTKILSVRPGFVITSRTANITLSNRGTFPLQVDYGKNETTLAPGQYETVSITPEKSFSYLEIKSYSNFLIPIIYAPLGGSVNNTTAEPEVPKGGLVSVPQLIQMKILAKQGSSYLLELVNNGSNNITYVKALTNLPGIEFFKVGDIDVGSKKILNMTVFSYDQGFLLGNITIEYMEGDSSYSLLVPAEIYIFPENTTENETVIETKSDTCADLGGQFCPICGGRSTYASDGLCCLGECSEVTETLEEGGGRFGWIIGIIIFIVLGVAGYFVYKKIKKVKPVKPEESIAHESKLYEKRVSGAVSRN